MALCIFAFSGDVMMALFYIIFGRMNTGIEFLFEDPLVFFKVLLICNFMNEYISFLNIIINHTQQKVFITMNISYMLYINAMLKIEGNKWMDSIRTKNEPSHLQEKPWKIHPHLCGLKNDFPLFQFRSTPSDMILYALECTWWPQSWKVLECPGFFMKISKVSWNVLDFFILRKDKNC